MIWYGAQWGRRNVAAVPYSFTAMAWITLNVTSLKSRLGTNEIDKLTEEAPSPDGKLAEVLSHVALEIVSRVNSGRRKRGLAPCVSTGLFIPPGSLRHAYALARKLLTDTFPSLAEYNGDDRKAAVDAAEEYLRFLADNNADSDDAGAESYVTTGATSGPRFGGAATMNFATIP